MKHPLLVGWTNIRCEVVQIESTTGGFPYASVKSTVSCAACDDVLTVTHTPYRGHRSVTTHFPHEGCTK